MKAVESCLIMSVLTSLHSVSPLAALPSFWVLAFQTVSVCASFLMLFLCRQRETKVHWPLWATRTWALAGGQPWAVWLQTHLSQEASALTAFRCTLKIPAKAHWPLSHCHKDGQSEATESPVLAVCFPFSCCLSSEVVAFSISVVSAPLL